MSTISTFHAATLIARLPEQKLQANAMGELGNLKFSVVDGGSPSVTRGGFFQRLKAKLETKYAGFIGLFHSGERRAAIREQGMALRAVKRSQHLFGKLSGDMAKGPNIASALKTINRMVASVPETKGLKATLMNPIAQAVGYTSAQDRAAIMGGIADLYSAVQGTKVALSTTQLQTLQMVMDQIKLKDGALPATTASTTAAAAKTAATASPPIPARPDGWVSSPKIAAEGPPPPIPARSEGLKSPAVGPKTAASTSPADASQSKAAATGNTSWAEQIAQSAMNLKKSTPDKAAVTPAAVPLTPSQEAKNKLRGPDEAQRHADALAKKLAGKAKSADKTAPQVAATKPTDVNISKPAITPGPVTPGTGGKAASAA